MDISDILDGRKKQDAESRSWARGIVFGVFDGLHDGHKYFISSARDACDVLVVAVAPDEIVRTLKKKYPRFTLDERISAISSFDPSLVVISGDDSVGSWKVIQDEKPDIVFLGYDQSEIKDEVIRMNMPFVTLEAHEPARFKSSLQDAMGA